MAKRAKCHVKFISGKLGPTAALIDHKGRWLNTMNYPRGHRFTAAEKTRARKMLMAGCAELSRDLDRYGNTRTETLLKARGLSGKRRRR